MSSCCWLARHSFVKLFLEIRAALLPTGLSAVTDVQQARDDAWHLSQLFVLLAARRVPGTSETLVKCMQPLKELQVDFKSWLSVDLLLLLEVAFSFSNLSSQSVRGFLSLHVLLSPFALLLRGSQFKKG